MVSANAPYSLTVVNYYSCLSNRFVSKDWKSVRFKKKNVAKYVELFCIKKLEFPSFEDILSECKTQQHFIRMQNFNRSNNVQQVHCSDYMCNFIAAVL